MDELIVNQVKYISSKRAASLTGYAKDYIGQLVRLGKLDAKRVGRAWYVNEEAIMAHAGMNVPKEAPVAAAAQPVLEKRQVPILPQTLHQGMPKTWGEIKYFAEESPVLPISDKRVENSASEITNKQNVLSRDILPTISSVTSVKINKPVVVLPQQRVLAMNAAGAGLSGVRTISRRPVAAVNTASKVATVAVHKPSSTSPLGQSAGVLVGALIFVLLIPLLS